MSALGRHSKLYNERHYSFTLKGAYFIVPVLLCVSVCVCVRAYMRACVCVLAGGGGGGGGGWRRLFFSSSCFTAIRINDTSCHVV